MERKVKRNKKKNNRETPGQYQPEKRAQREYMKENYSWNFLVKKYNFPKKKKKNRKMMMKKE